MERYAEILRHRLGITPTPLLSLPELTIAQGLQLFVKDEGQNETGSFKPRVMAPLVDQVDKENKTLTTTVTTGNQGIAIAYAAKQLGIQAKIFTPLSAPGYKIQAMKAYGAEVESKGDYHFAFEQAQDFATNNPTCYLVEHGGICQIMSYSTLALELLVDMRTRDIEPHQTCVITPVGAGGLAAGLFHYLHGAGVTTVAVQSHHTDTLMASVRAGYARPDIPALGILEDGINTGGLEEPAFECLRNTFDAIVVVDSGDPEAGQAPICAALEYYGNAGILSEGAGMLPWLAVVQSRALTEFLRMRHITSTILINTGRNLDPAVYLASRRLAPEIPTPAPVDPSRVRFAAFW